MVNAELNAINEAIDEAQRFLERARSLRKQISDASHDPIPSRKRSSAVRASLDLSKSLSEFRKVRTNGNCC